MDRAPAVDRRDVERIIDRDFPQTDASTVTDSLNEYGHESWHYEPVRVHLAILKLCRGELEELQRFVGIAQKDFRDVLAPAEYPLSIALTFAAAARRADGAMMSAELQELQESDWQHYHEWLGSEEFCGGPVNEGVAAAQEHFFRGPTTRTGGMPGWYGLIVGPILGVLLALPGFFEEKNVFPLALGAGLGLVAGLVMWGMDKKLPS